MRIEVTQQDIDDGIIGNSCWCPIARAIKRATGRGYLTVDDGTTTIDGSDYLLPCAAINFIGNFDANRAVRPFAFDLPIDHLIGGTP